MTTGAASLRERWRITIQGIVQGVGFRPFVYGQAVRWQLGGFVLNDSNGVTIEVEGTGEQLHNFRRALQEQPPPLARIDTLVTAQIALRHETSFLISPSQANAGRSALISPDTAVCDDCLRELFTPGDRRYRYPFINCTNCGPRFTIIQDVPYDREQTTMRVFPMCPECQSEYENPLSRRFHAQPNACPRCGPQVRLLTARLAAVDCAHPIAVAAQWLADGALLAVKGLGGYHLACDALNAEAVTRLRQRKRREARPFALMVPDVATAQQLCLLQAEEGTLLQSYRRAIVLFRQRASCPVAPGVAPGCHTLGIMLPYTPLHYLLLDAVASSFPQGSPVALVMTSGNLSDEPIVYRDEDAFERLTSIADGLLVHNRAIHMRCDDSVMRSVAGREQFLRRSRGFAPEPLTLPQACPVPLLACGGHLKNTFCLAKGQQAFISHHIGDLDNLETLLSFREGIEHVQRLFGIVPQAIAYDLHPEYLATHYALSSDITTRVGVQHHHAHIASVLAEHGLTGPVIGVAADGTGYGTDGAIWGSEILLADLSDFTRLAHLAYLPLPGGEQAIRQPWRMAASYLWQAYGESFCTLDIPFMQRVDQQRLHILMQMIERGFNAPPTSSLGRLFDAVAALLTVRHEVVYEGQAAIELETLAEQAPPFQEPYPFLVQSGSPAILDVAPMIRAIVLDIQQGVPVPQIARRFHCTVADMLVEACVLARARFGLNEVALSGGVFQNALLLDLLVAALEQQGFCVYTNRRVPPNDGGLSFGQLAVAAARLRRAADKNG